MSIKMHPMLFSTPMVKAVGDDLKTVTRRIVKQELVIDPDSGYVYIHDDMVVLDIHNWKEEFIKLYSKYLVGDIIWVRETFCEPVLFDGAEEDYYYKADGIDVKSIRWSNGKWKPNIFMPFAACRYFLEVTEVSIEKLQDITKKEARAEGVKYYNDGITKTPRYKDYLADASGYGHPEHDYPTVGSAVESFKTLWISINDEDSWDSNPLVWVIRFKKSKKVVKCLYGKCDKLFIPQKHQLFCSENCQGKNKKMIIRYRRKKQRKPNGPQKCKREDCSNIFTRADKVSRQFYCSVRCQGMVSDRKKRRKKKLLNSNIS